MAPLSRCYLSTVALLKTASLVVSNAVSLTSACLLFVRMLYSGLYKLYLVT